MRVDHAGASPALSVTARPTENRTNTEQNHAVIRRTVDALVSVTGCRRAEARERIAAWQAGGNAVADLEAWLRANYRVDPTGVTAVRNVARVGGGSHV